MVKDSINVFLKVKKEDIYIICPFFEAFDGMAAIRTPKTQDGPYAILKLMVSPDFINDFNQLLKTLSQRVSFEELSENP